MKRWMFFAALFIIYLIIPEGQGVDVARLKPVEFLCVCQEAGRVKVIADTQDYGVGNTLEAALTDLERSAEGVVFLDTVDFVLITEQTRDQLPYICKTLRPAARLVLAAGVVEPETAAAYLRAHETELTLMDYRKGRRDLPKLMTGGEGRYVLQ